MKVHHINNSYYMFVITRESNIRSIYFNLMNYTYIPYLYIDIYDVPFKRESANLNNYFPIFKFNSCF